MRRKVPHHLSRLLGVGILLTLLVSTSCGGKDPFSSATVITSDAQLIGGPAALGKVGDFLLQNDQIKVIVRNAGTSPGFGLYGGCLLDVDLVRGPEEFGGRGNDRFGEMFSLVNFVAAQPDPDAEDPQVFVYKDGLDGGEAIIRVEGRRAGYLYLLRLLTDLLNSDEDLFTVRTDYILHPGASYVEIQTEVFIDEETAAANGLAPEIRWIDLLDSDEAVDAFAQMVNGQVPPILAEGEDLEVDEIDDTIVRSASVDFEAAGVLVGQEIKIDDGADGLVERVIEAVSPGELILDEGVSIAEGGAYFRVLGPRGEAGEVFGDFIFMGAKVKFFLPDDENPERASWNGGMGPGIGYDHTGTMLEIFRADQSTFTDPFLTDFYAGTAEGVSYAYGTKEGKVSVPILAESFSALFSHDSDFHTYLVPGNGLRFTRYLTVGEGDVASAAGVLMEEVRGESLGRIEGHVLDGRRGSGVSGVKVLAFRDPDPDSDELPGRSALAGPVTAFETDLYRDRIEDGSFGGPMRPGTYLLIASGPGHVRSDPVRVTVTDGDTAGATIVLPETGTVIYDVVDAREQHIPCKLTFVGEDGAGKPDPMLGDAYLPGDLAQVVFADDGMGELELEPGRYLVQISRGPEYSIDEHTLTVEPGVSVRINGHIARVVDTTGWVSGDFHQHMYGSPDSGLSYHDRVLTNLCEGVEYVVASDHDMITDLRPMIEALGATEFIKSSAGDELTTIEQGHFNGWPLAFDPSAPEDGAVDWQMPSPTDSATFDNPSLYQELNVFTPANIFDALRDAGTYGPDDTVVQINHYRDGMLGYTYQFMVDVETGEPTSELNYLLLMHPRINMDFFDWDFNAMEVSNGKRQDIIRTPTTKETAEYLEGRGTVYTYLARSAEEQEALRTGETNLDRDYAGGLDDWFNWLNLGRVYTLTGNSDSHTKTKTEAGVVRNYVRSSTDLPGLIDERELARNVNSGKVTHSYGPFIEFEVSGGSNGPGDLGGTVLDDDGTVDLHIEVQSPTWFDVDRIEVYQNGVMVCEITSDFTCGEPAENLGLFHPNHEVLNFDGVVSIDLTDWWFLATPDDEIPGAPQPLDSWFAVAAMGDSSMAPVASELTREPLRVADILSASMSALRFEDMSSALLSGIDINMGADFHTIFPIVPWGITNAVFVDADGDGEWTPPGLPGYLGYYEIEE